MKKKLIKMTKIFLVLTLIFSQLSSITKVLAEETMDETGIIDNSDKEEAKKLLVNGYLEYEDSTLPGTVENGVIKYNVSASGKYVQKLTIAEIGSTTPVFDDDKDYSVKVNGINKESIKGKELNTGLTVREFDLTNSFNTVIEYTDKVEITELGENDQEPIVLEYNAVLIYEQDGNSFDEFLNDLYDGYTFKDGNLIVNAKELPLEPEVPSIQYLNSLLNENDGVTLEVFDKDKNLVTLEDDDTSDTEPAEELVKNGYTLKFTKGLSEAYYNVIVMGDVTDDSIFNKNDMIPTMEGYLNEENIPSMDLYVSSHETEIDGEYENDPFGTVTFEDIMTINGYLNFSDTQRENINLSLTLSTDADELCVGDTFKVQILVNSNDLEDYINGITGIISYSENVKLLSIEFNENLIGTYNEENKFVGAGKSITNGQVVMTLSFMAINTGEGVISLTGKMANDMIISDFEELTTSVDIVRKNSNNYLSSLKASVGTFDIDFDKDVTVYTLTVPHDTQSVILSGALDDIYSSAEGLIEYDLTEDKTTANVIVTAEDGSIRVYTVYIIKEAKPVEEAKPITYYYSSNNYLKLLEIDEYEIDFDKEVSEYQIKVKSDVNSLEIKAIAEDSRARVEITGNENFKKGENIVTITVTAENGETREYKLIVNKDAEKKEAVTEIDDSSNTAEKIVIIVLIILVVLGLLYLIFKKDDEEIPEVEEKKSEVTKKNKTDVTKNKKNKK